MCLNVCIKKKGSASNRSKRHTSTPAADSEEITDRMEPKMFVQLGKVDFASFGTLKRPHQLV